MFRQGGEARDLLCPTTNHLHRARQKIIKLPDVLCIISQRTSRFYLELQQNPLSERRKLMYSVWIAALHQSAYFRVVKVRRLRV